MHSPKKEAVMGSDTYFNNHMDGNMMEWDVSIGNQMLNVLPKE